MAKRFKFQPADGPQCPVHHVPMLVRRTLQEVQYRYCPLPGCRRSERTRRPVLQRVCQEQADG